MRTLVLVFGFLIAVSVDLAPELSLAALAACSTPVESATTHEIACSDPGCIDPATGYGDATTGTDGTGWWFASGSWHISFAGPEDAVITGVSVELQDNGSGNGQPPAPVTLTLRESRDGGSTWTTITNETSCGCGADITLSPTVIHQTSQGMFELMLTSNTSNPSYVFNVSVATGTLTTILLPPHDIVGWRGAQVTYTATATFSAFASEDFSIPSGSVISSVSANVTDGVGAPVAVVLASTDSAGVEHDIKTVTSAGTGLPQQVDMTGLYVPIGGAGYWIGFKPIGGPVSVAWTGITYH